MHGQQLETQLTVVLAATVHREEHGHHQGQRARLQVRRHSSSSRWRRTSTDRRGRASEIRSARESECFQKARLLQAMLPSAELFKKSAQWLDARCVREHAIRSTRVRPVLPLGLCIPLVCGA